MQESNNFVNVLSAMITPAVLISACATLIISTSTRLARIVDRVRELSRQIEEMSRTEETLDFIEDRRTEVDRQISIQTRRSRLIQNSLTSFYISLSLFVAATVAIGVISLFPSILQTVIWAPNSLGMIGTGILFYGCVMLIAETRLALRSVNSEMQFTLKLREKYQERRMMREQELGKSAATKVAAKVGE
jgi:type IV secretory pathway VirB6-like protein